MHTCKLNENYEKNYIKVLHTNWAANTLPHVYKGFYISHSTVTVQI